MADRDEWFEVYLSGKPETAEPGVPETASAGFRVEPEAAPAMRAGFEAAIEEMILARQAALEFRSLGGESVNPVVDKYMAAMIDRAVGEEGSLLVAVNSAITEYQRVIEQLDAAMAGYRSGDDSTANTVEGLS